MEYSKRDFKNWKAYEQVRRSGQFNMITDCVQASKASKLSMETYKKMVLHYGAIEQAIIREYGSVENYLG